MSPNTHTHTNLGGRATSSLASISHILWIAWISSASQLCFFPLQDPYIRDETGRWTGQYSSTFASMTTCDTMLIYVGTSRRLVLLQLLLLLLLSGLCCRAQQNSR